MAPPALPDLQTAHIVSARDLAVWDRVVAMGGDLLTNLGVAALIGLASLWVAKWAGGMTQRAVERLKRHGDPDETLALFFSSVVRNSIYLLAAIAILEQLGVKTTSILAGVAAASLAIGLALQGALSNVASGVLILLIRPYRVGDILETAGHVGRVRMMDMFVTELATLDNLKIVIPNSKIFADVMTNHTFHERRRADTIFRTPTTTDVPGLIRRLNAWILDDPRIVSDPAPIIELTSVTEGALEFAVRPWAATDDYAVVKADLLLCAQALEADPKAQLPQPSTPPKGAMVRPV